MRVDRVMVLGFVVAASGAAYATGWDWSMDLQSRHWRTASQSWAQTVHPDHPSVTWIQANFYPPPHEMWCHTSPAPRSADCTEFHTRLNAWLQDYLVTDAVPQKAFDTFPKECTSICTP
jgi:hypothetical protein